MNTITVIMDIPTDEQTESYSSERGYQARFDYMVWQAELKHPGWVYAGERMGWDNSQVRPDGKYTILLKRK